MAAPVVVTADTGASTNTLVVPAPTNVAADDLVVIYTGYFDSVSTVESIAGFTEVPRAAVSERGIWWWKRSTGSEPASYTLTLTPSGGSSARLSQAFRVTGAIKTGNPIRTDDKLRNTASLSTPAITLAGLAVDDLILYGVYLSQFNANLSAVPSGFTRQSAALSQRIHVASQAVTVAGSSGAISGTISGSAQIMTAAAIAIKPPDVVQTTITATATKATTDIQATDRQATIGATATKATAAMDLQNVANNVTITATATKATTSVTADNNQATVTATAKKATSSMAVDVYDPATITATATKATVAISAGVESKVNIGATASKATVAIAIETSTPPTWQETIRSPEYKAAASARVRTVSARVDMITEDDVVVATLPVIGGNVSCDSTQDERWQATITIADADLMPVAVDDLLHPLSGLRVRIWWLLRLPSGFIAEVPCGTYYSSSPAASMGGQGFGMSAKLLDVFSRIRRNKWGPGDVIDLGGMNVAAALRILFASRAPKMAVQIHETDAVLPDIYEVGTVGRDPLADILAVADAAAFTVYTDRLGGAICEPRTTTSNTATVLNLSEGPNSRMESINRSLDESQLLNTLTVMSTSPDVDPPVFATVEDNDPASPLWVGRGDIYSDVIQSDAVTTEDACIALGNAMLSERRALLEAVDVVHRIRPEIDPMALIDVTESKTGADGVYQIASISFDLAPGSMQRTVASTRRQEV